MVRLAGATRAHWFRVHQIRGPPIARPLTSDGSIVTGACDPSDDPGLPRDFSVRDILGAPLEAREPEVRRPVVAPEQQARAALWELDFALQELDWLRRGEVREQQLVESVARQIALGARHVEAYPLGLLPLPGDLRAQLADRFSRLADALDDLAPGWRSHEDLTGAHERLRAGLEQRGVDVD